MKRLGLLLALSSFLALAGSGSAHAAFGLSELSVSFTEEDGSAARQAGSHPYAMRVGFRVNSKVHPEKKVNVVDGALRTLEVVLPAGFIGNPTAVPTCETFDFLTTDTFGHPGCADSTALGHLTVKLGGGLGTEGEETVAVYNMEPSSGTAAKLGFIVAEAPIVLEVGIIDRHPYQIVTRFRNATQVVEVLSSDVTLWGTPADPSHDPDRGDCGFSNFSKGATCPAKFPERPSITLPRSCDGPLVTSFFAESWWSGDPINPGPSESFKGEAQSPSLTGCSKLTFTPSQSAVPSTDQAESPSGLSFEINVDDEGITNPHGIAASDIRDLTVTLPAGMTANPSVADGLAVCSPGDLARETASLAPGEGCPEAAKIGTIEAETPVLEEEVLRGTLYVATPDDPTTPQAGAENPFDTLIAQYLVIEDPELGLIAKLPGVLLPDPETGQLVATFEDLPPVPISAARVRLKEGGRSPLITPPVCGTHETAADFTPAADPSRVLRATSTFRITRGVGGGHCPSGAQPFDPGFRAGSLSNHAAAHTPVHMRLTRRDGDQDLTRFDATLPEGLLAKLKGVSKCPDAAMAQADAKTGKAELASPSCPPSSRIGGVWGGTGVGSQLIYVPGDLYLAGPVGKAPLSVVAIVPAVAGPFDVGTVVVRQAVRVHPVTGKLEVDGASSDPIPHILAGIPLRVRDIRVDVDRPEFTLNPTDCSPFATVAQIWGGGADVFSVADDSPVSRQSRFQAANCSRLGFKPRMGMSLRGGTSRGGHPALRMVIRPRKGDANISSLSLRFPRSAFIEQSHFRTICTRVQFVVDACPKAAIYGHVTAFTPLLDEPLKGPVFLRSSSNDLPDAVADLHGLVDVEAVGRIDSVRGRLRVAVDSVPDAPLSKVIVQMQGGDKGLFVNSRNLCAGPSRALVRFGAQNAKSRSSRPAVRPLGCKRRSGKKSRR